MKSLCDFCSSSSDKINNTEIDEARGMFLVSVKEPDAMPRRRREETIKMYLG
jgi:hypothetical protein